MVAAIGLGGASPSACEAMGWAVAVVSGEGGEVVRGMEIRFKCPCGKVLGAPEHAAGRKARCPACERRLRVPGGEAEPEEKAKEKAKEKETVTRTRQRSERLDAPATGMADIVAAHADAEDEAVRIVVADSNPAELETLRKMLADHGFEVYAAADGEQAVEYIRKYKPALAIVDLKMDKMGGFQMVKAISDQFNPLNQDVWDMPILMTCPKITGRDKQYAISLGVKFYFEKPLVPTKVFERIERLLGRFASGGRPR